MQIIITMDGGVIQDVTADAEVDLTVIDYDTEGVDADRLTTMQHENGWGSSAVVFDPGVTVDPEHVATITAYLSSGEGEQPAAPQEGQQTASGEERTRIGNTPTTAEDELLEAAAEAQTAYWNALRELEEATGLDIDSTQDLAGKTVADLTEN